VLTLGDHTWQRKEAKPFIEDNQDWCIRPANYPKGAPGKGWTIFEKGPLKIGIFNLMGRTFINGALDCPFQTADEILSDPLNGTPVRICDKHAEATSEKFAMARHLDGRVSLQVGTHTHVQTADEQILPEGTAYITDLGMSGSPEGVIGMDAEVALARFRTGMPHAYKIAGGAGFVSGVVCEIDSATGKALSISRVRAGEDGKLR
jgi:2',3'-cyclic-nucleotide 2'-phosphodiesterase